MFAALLRYVITFYINSGRIEKSEKYCADWAINSSNYEKVSDEILKRERYYLVLAFQGQVVLAALEPLNLFFCKPGL